MASVSKAYLGFLRFATFQCGVLAFFAVFSPELFESIAYKWAVDLLPLEVYAAGWIGLLVCGLTILWSIRKDGSANLFMLVWWSAWYSIIQFLFAFSIFTLTFDGFTGASAGALQWGGLAVVSWLWLRHREG